MGELLCGSPFAFYIQAHSTTRPAPKLKSVGVQPLGFGKGWSLPQERNSASRNLKFAHIKRRKSVSTNTERTEPQIQKAACRKRNSRAAIPHSKPNHWRASILHAALTENSRPPAGGYAVGQPFRKKRRKVTWFDKSAEYSPHKAAKFKQNRNPSEMLCSADTDSQVTYRRLSAVDRYIIAVRRCYRSICRMQD